MPKQSLLIVATIVADASTKVKLWNPAAEQLFGYKQKDVIGLNIDDLITTADIHAGASAGSATDKGDDRSDAGLNRLFGTRKKLLAL